MRAGLGILIVVGVACGRTEPLRSPPSEAPVVGEDAGFDAGVDAGVDAGADAGFDAGVLDAGCVEEVERHVVPAATRRPIDILFVIDDSCSMGDDQEALAQNFDHFLNAFTANQVDFHLGVVTTDMYQRDRRGRLVGPVLTAQTPNLALELRTQILVGESGSGNERGMDAAHSAFIYPFHPAPNDDFLRAEADFALVFVSDEDDSSIISVNALERFLKDLKPDPSSLTVAAVVGLVSNPKICDASAVGQWRDVQLAQRFGARGITAVCDGNYATTLRAISGRALENLCLVGLDHVLEESERLYFNGEPATYQLFPPDQDFPFGSVQLTPCPPSGGLLVVSAGRCQP